MSRLALLAALPCLAACGGAEPPPPVVPEPVSIATPPASPLSPASVPDGRGSPQPASTLAVEVTAPKRPDTKLDARLRSERDRERKRILEEETGRADGGAAP